MGVFEFLNRHKNKIMMAGGAVGAIVVINKVLANYEKQWQTSSSKGFVHETKKKEIHFENIINECNQFCQRMSTRMMDRLQELMDDHHLIENLRKLRKESNPSEKIENWKALRLNIITRLLSELYCTCILVCYMRVQMSIVGAQVYLQSMNYVPRPESKEDSSSSTRSNDLSHMRAYTKYHALLGSFYERKFESLVEPLEEVVREILKEYNVDYSISIQDFKTILEKIKVEFSNYLYNPNSKTKLLFFEPDELPNIDLAWEANQSLSKQDEDILRSLLGETQDILESDDFRHVLQSSIDVGYAVLMDSLVFDAFIKMENCNGGNRSGFFPDQIQVPMVKILPQIRSNYISRSETDKKALVNHLLCLDVLNCFAANVYEAFCVPKC